MRVVLKQNVLEKAKDRIRWLFDEFPEVVVNVSGGKDSTVCFHLALEVAEELGRLPVTCLWIDQEAEWQGTVDIVSEWMHDPRVNPIWLQVPFRIFNATSGTANWLDAWEEGKDDLWIHPRDPIAKTENVYGVDRFTKLFEGAMRYHFDGVKVARLSGVRAEESAARLYGITGHELYKGETWGNGSGLKGGQEHMTFYPIYDWSYTDVWKFIHDRGVNYNRIYDLQYQYGVDIRKMRVSNLHHETAVTALFYVQEFEPETYARLTARLQGTDMANKMGVDDYFPDELPFMFEDWAEYRDYLLDKLITIPEWKERMGKRFETQQRKMHPSKHDLMFRIHVKSILVNDWEGILCDNFSTTVERSLRDVTKTPEPATKESA
jgi:predicted phosphoadenosine phosphosulfate sulfurtransferase